MAAKISEKRNLWWAVAFGLLGGLNVLDYFYKYSFQPDDLLKGAGFLLVVPLAYLYPHYFDFKRGSARVTPAVWARALAFIGLGLVLIGFLVEWL
jgi:hypothetical protein